MASEQKLDPKYDDYDYPTVAPVAQSGHPGHTTPQQDAQVFQLRMLLEQQGFTDRLDTLTLLRFLRARKFNVEDAKKMFVDCENWRKEFGVTDEFVATFQLPEDIRALVTKQYPQFYHKTDKDGRPVYIEQLGGIVPKELEPHKDAMLRRLVVEYERLADPRLPACSRKSGQLLETCCTIMDLKGVGMMNAYYSKPILQSASAVSQNYYPERLGKLYVINAPWGFSALWEAVKRFLDPVTAEKVKILDHKYQKVLLSQVPAENLPEAFGGTCKCPGGCQNSNAGPWQDPEWARPAKWEKGAKASVPEKSTEESTESTATESGHDPTPVLENSTGNEGLGEKPQTMPA